MATMTDERVDAYIAKAAPFAQPILSHLRELVHRAGPQATETIKWGFPHFEHKGILCSMAAFKEHCTFGFWKAELMTDPEHVLAGVGKTAMGHFGRIQNLDDLPRDDVLVAYIQEAARLNETGTKAPQRAAAARPVELETPEYLLQALRANEAAEKTFADFSPYKKREYVEWLVGAKTEKTRTQRLATAVELMSEGKELNWKYAK